MRGTRLTNFIFELMIVTLIFSVASAICVTIYVKSWQMSRESQDLMEATFIISDVADQYQAGVDPKSLNGKFDNTQNFTSNEEVVFDIEVVEVNDYSIIIYLKDGEKTIEEMKVQRNIEYAK
jgi:type II secretory pathway pseudopilin PulG